MTTTQALVADTFSAGQQAQKADHVFCCETTWLVVTVLKLHPLQLRQPFKINNINSCIVIVVDTATTLAVQKMSSLPLPS